MRNIAEDDGGTWATYIKRVRTNLNLSVSAFGGLLGVDRATVYRWESGRTVAEDPELLARISQRTSIDLDELLAAAGLRRTGPPPAEPSQEIDEDMEQILSSDLPRRIKDELIAHLEGMRERDRQRRIEEMERMIRLMGGRSQTG